jgi:nucleotide-binding universal stress UspA family protein
MFSTILLPLDGSPLAEQAVPHAEWLAQRLAARVVLTRVLPIVTSTGQIDDLAVATSARAYLDQIAARLSEHSVDCQSVLPAGHPATEILDQARTSSADLIVMATHGRSGPSRWLYGSVADAVLRECPIPVLLVPPHVVAPAPIDQSLRFLVPLDGSAIGETALKPASELAHRLSAELVLIQVVPWPPISYGDGSELMYIDPEPMLGVARDYLAQIAARLQPTLERPVRVRAELGRPTPAIIAEIADREHANLIAMSTHGRSGLARLVLGSVASGTLQRANVPLLLTRPQTLSAQSNHDHEALVAAAPADTAK